MSALAESGIGWIGRMPSHWSIAKICLVARLESGHTPSRLHPEYWVPAECTIPWFGLADVWQLRSGVQEYLGETKELISARGMANSAARLLPAGTVVLSRTASVGFSGIMPRPMATTQDFANWVCGPRVQPEYLLYVLRAMSEELRRSFMGSTHQTIYMPDLRRLTVPIPPREEQARIVKRLRTRLPKIDALIARKERLIELLQEKRQALITQAVTKGLDPTVPMKDSGIDWLGKIPAQWQVRELRHNLFRIEQGWSPMCESREADPGEWGVLKVGCVNYGHFRESENKALPVQEQPVPALEVRAGDVLISRANTRELVGSAAYVRHTRPRLLLCDKLFRLRTTPSTNSEFLVLLLQSSICRLQFERDATGASGSMQNIGQDSVRRLVFAWPDLTAQKDIVDHVASGSAHIDQLKMNLGRQIETLREYRQALISAAVTGKLDVTKEPS